MTTRSEDEKTSPAADWAAIVFALLLPSLVTLSYFVWAEALPSHLQQFIYSVAKVVQFGFPAVWVLFVLKHRPRWQEPVTRGLVWGLLFGLAVSAAMLVLYHFWLQATDVFQAAAGEINKKVTDLQLNVPWRFIILGLFYSLVHALLEEYYWRWFVFGQLARRTALWTAVLVSAIGFTTHHVIILSTYFGPTAIETWLFSAGIAVGGVFWAWLYHRSGSLLGPWIGHLLIDAAIFAIGYDIVFN